MRTFYGSGLSALMNGIVTFRVRKNRRCTPAFAGMRLTTVLRPKTVVLWFLAISLAAQVRYPGQTGPYPGQTGPYPTGSPIPGGSPFPGGRPKGGRGSGGPSTPGRGKSVAPIPVTTTGILRAATAAQLVLEADDHRIITYKLTEKTTVEKDGKPAEIGSFSMADHLTVDATADDGNFFTAVSVVFNSPGTREEREEASRTWDLLPLDGNSNSAGARQDSDDARPVIRRGGGAPPAGAQSSERTQPNAQEDAATASAPNATTPNATAMKPPDAPPDADDPGRPQLRRGRPSARSTARADEPELPAAARRDNATDVAPNVSLAGEPSAPTSADVIPVQEDPVIAKAREANAQYSLTLPNFLVRQAITRYEADNPKQGWQARDTVTADLTYEDGNEEYKNVKVGNRPVKSIEDTGGSWSTGQFATILEEILDPGTATTFRKSGQDTIQGRRADIFKFEVKRENARWRIMVPSQLYYPAYRGSLWIDKETARVLRVEMESKNIPPLFPLAKVETAIDYDFVRLGGTQAFLLPTVAEVLSCEQGSSRCTRNRIEYRNYRKFGAQSDISFDDKQ
jgi:hypothetical protein